MHGRGRPAQQEPERPIVWAFLGSLTQRPGMNRPKHRTADRVDDRDHVGVHEQSDGNVYIGTVARAGRTSGTQLQRVAELVVDGFAY